MQQEALIQAIVGARGQLDFIWQVFLSAQVAVFAFLLIYEEEMEKMNFLGRLLALIGIGAFDWINASALIDTYGLLDALHHQYRVSFGQLNGLSPLFVDRFVNASYETGPRMVAFTHTLAFTFVLLSFVLRNMIRRDRTG